MNFYLRNQTKRSLWLLLSWRVVTTRTMKFQHLERAFWDKKFSACASSSSSCSSSSSSTLGAFKRLRPLALTAASTVKLPLTPLELKSFSFSKASSTHLQHQHASGGGTRWNPTQEQIRKLESLYKSGVRTPNAQQIEKITAELMKHGRIEGKNVFYWFQNHKARERQKQKRNALLASSSPMEVSDTTKVAEESRGGKDGRSKRRSRSWGAELDQINEGGADDDGITLELFPLQPEKINDNI